MITNNRFSMFSPRGLSISPQHYPTPYDCIVSNEDDQLLLCIGDSLTAVDYGYHQVIQDNLRTLGYNTIVIKRASESGYRIDDIYHFLIDGYLTSNPTCKVFTILLGTNNTKPSLVNSEWWAAKYCYYQLIKFIKNRVPDAEIRICQIPWVSPNTTDATFLPASTWESNKDIINKIIRTMARHFGMPEAPDLYEVTKNQIGWYIADGLHFSTTGYRNLAPIFTNLLKQVPSYTADENFIVGKTYAVSGGIVAPGFADDGKKLSKGNLQNIKEQPLYTDGNGIGINAAANGGYGATVNVAVDFHFGEEVIINDVIAVNGSGGQNYSADSIAIYSFDGSTYTLVETITNTSEDAVPGNSAPWWCMFTPATPFKTRGLRIIYTKTFSVSADWLFINEINATRLNGYSL